MTDLIVELSKYLMTLLFAFYTYECFSSFRGKLTPEKRAKIFKRQMCLMYLIHLDAFLAIYAVTDDIRMILFYVVQAAFIAVTISSYRLVYGRASGLLINNMCMLLMIGFIMITRLSFDKAIRQFAIAVGAMVCSLIIPVLIQKVRFLRKCRGFTQLPGSSVFWRFWRSESRAAVRKYQSRLPEYRFSRVNLSRSYLYFLWHVCFTRIRI